MTEESAIARAISAREKYGRCTVYSAACDNCGEIGFSLGASARYGRGRKKAFFCSRRCAYASKGTTHPAWRGGRTWDSGGYVMVSVPGHPRASVYKSHYVREHIVVMEQMLGRYLRPGENVHHKNGRRDDNRPSNLELWTVSQPPGQRVDDVLDYVINDYEKELRAKLEIKDLVRSVIARVTNTAPSQQP